LLEQLHEGPNVDPLGLVRKKVDVIRHQAIRFEHDPVH